MRTKEKLAYTLRRHNAPMEMIEAASNGRYDDFESPSPTPMMDLVRDCQASDLDEVAQMAMGGEFDGTEQEVEEWFQREGRFL